MISIITPVLNGAEFIEYNIKSIRSLDIPFEHIIVDGGSTDGTLDIVSGFPHVKLLHQTGKGGMYEAIHEGFMKAEGDIFAYVNADDRIIKKGYEKMYSAIIRNHFDVVYSDSYLMYGNNRTKSRAARFAKYFLKKGIFPFVQPSSLFTKDAYFRIGGFDYKDFRVCGDLDFFHRLASAAGSRFHYCPTESSIFLVRENSLGSTQRDRSKREKISRNIPADPHLLDRLLFLLAKYV